jgi:hypothetical protein
MHKDQKKLRENLRRAVEDFDYKAATSVHNYISDDATTEEQMREDLEYRIQALYDKVKVIYDQQPENDDPMAILWKMGHDLGEIEDGIYIRIWMTGEVEISYRPVMVSIEG